ncbi:Hypothetical predicted protein [Mytilus galloprovincialis]|uniref:Uncharacterized protein n=1 Tax=Mytilus galloprovincialis TaxID=29158 RepID=A0A8B6DVH8_MYTGA|nr:Hypothetical predicted protein [Mytilus galloprovincialis]
MQRHSELKVLYEVEIKPNIVGGKKPYYFNLKCEDGPRNLTASATFNQTKYDAQYNAKSKNVPWNAQLTLKISTDIAGKATIDKDIEIGQALYLFMTVSANFTISPEKCVAKPTDGKDEDSITMWNVTR